MLPRRIPYSDFFDRLSSRDGRYVTELMIAAAFDRRGLATLLAMSSPSLSDV